MALYGYCRVSTAEQVDGTSLDDQKAVVMAAGVPAENVFTDGGVSGSANLSDRPQGKLMLAALKPGDTIVAAKLDRLFRSADDAIGRVKSFKAQGIDVVLLDMGREPVSGNGAAKFFFGMLAVAAEFERDRTRERISDGQKAKKAAGGHIGGYAPFGYRKEGEKTAAVLVSVPTEQAAIQQILQMHSESKSLGNITKTIRAQGMKISKTTVYRILNPESRKRRKPPLKKRKEASAREAEETTHT